MAEETADSSVIVTFIMTVIAMIIKTCVSIMYLINHVLPAWQWHDRSVVNACFEIFFFSFFFLFFLAFTTTYLTKDSVQ